MMVDLEQFRFRLQSFACKYPGYETDPYDFDEFWRWKLRVETQNEHILDDTHRRQTYLRLRRALPKWRTYRPYNSATCLRILEDSLGKISNAYNKIRSYSLLEFNEVPDKPLKLIWNELGRVKERGGNRNSRRYYYIVAVSKPLIFLWGQTLAFDSRVRAHIPRFNFHSYVIKDTRWSFRTWKRVMESFQEDLAREPEVVGLFKEESLRRYGTDHTVPYGRFLDIYYFEGG